MGFQMFFIVLMVTITITTCTAVSQKNYKPFIGQYHEDNYDSIEELTKEIDLKESIIREGNRLLKEASDRPAGKYEVTENIVDVPNNETNFGPIITNYTVSIPLNTATINQTEDIETEVEKEDNTSNSNEDIDEEYFYTEDDNAQLLQHGLGAKLPAKFINFSSLLKDFIKVAKSDIKDFVKGAKKGLVDGANNAINHIHNDATKNNKEVRKMPKIVTVPFWLIKTLFNKK